MKIKKIISLVLAFTLAACMFAGCGKKTENAGEGEKTVISVGNWPTTPGEALDVKNEEKAKYEANNPDALIEPSEWVFDVKTFYAKAAGGQLPTVYNVPFTEVAQIVDSGYAADLTEALKKHGFEGKFNEKVIDVVSRNGKIYAFPFNAYVLGLAFNTDMFKAAGLMEEDGTPKQPKDWNEVAEFAVKIKEATGKPGIILPSAKNSGGWIFSCLAWSFGVDFMEKDADGKWKATFNSAEAAEALQYVKDLKWKYDVLPANTLIDSTEWYKTFGTGGAAMTITSADFPRRLVQYGMQPESVGYMALPAGPKRNVTLLGGGIYCVSQTATEEQIDAAIRYIKMLYNHELTEDYKESERIRVELQKNENQLVGIKGMSVWSSDTESVAFTNKTIDEFANANPNHVRLYNEFVMNCPADIQPEEPVCAQELYATLDNCIQEVLTNENADCAVVLEKANADFQANYLDNLSY